jgi:hypothetical protein
MNVPANPPPAQLLPVVPIQADRELYAALMCIGGDNRRRRENGFPIVDPLDLIAAHRIAHSPERGELASLVEADYVEGLERALKALRDAAELDMCADMPEGVDGGFIDVANDALRAKYPVIWTDEQVATLQAWQDCGWVHQLTCANRPHGFFDEDGNALDDALIPTSRGLFCGGCDYHQTTVPEVCLGPLPPNPTSALQALSATTVGDRL